MTEEKLLTETQWREMYGWEQLQTQNKQLKKDIRRQAKNQDVRIERLLRKLVKSKP